MTTVPDRPSAREPALTLAAMLLAFLLMTAYSLLKPLRDEVGSEHRDVLSWLWSGTFLVMLAAVPWFGRVSARLRRDRLVARVLRFFALNLLAFFLLRLQLPTASTAATWVDYAFYIWVSVFNLYTLSLFWSVLADLSRSDSGKRNFARIMLGTTLGAICGPLLVTALVQHIGPVHLLLISAVLLECSLHCFRRLPLLREQDSAAREGRALGGSIWNGATQVKESPYLRRICLYLLFLLIGSGFLYRLKADFAHEAFAGDREARTAFFAQVEVASNVLTLLLQAFVTGRILQKKGVGFTLAILPIATLLTFGALGAVLSLTTIAIADVLRRGGNYALAKPARELLFTVVPREQKYKSKSFIDTVVYRGGDSAVSWMYDLFALALDPAGLAFAVLPFAAVWAFLARRLGRGFRSAEQSTHGAGRPAEELPVDRVEG